MEQLQALIASYGDELQTYGPGFTSDQMQTLSDLYAASCMDEDLVKQRSTFASEVSLHSFHVGDANAVWFLLLSLEQHLWLADVDLFIRETSAFSRYEEEAKQTLLLSLCLNRKLKLGLLHALIASYGDELQTYGPGFTSDQMQTLSDLYAASCMDEDLVKQRSTFASEVSLHSFHVGDANAVWFLLLSLEQHLWLADVDLFIRRHQLLADMKKKLSRLCCFPYA
ncbi:hypothetical protein Dimus_005429 [Dionaea muscipula]